MKSRILTLFGIILLVLGGASLTNVSIKAGSQAQTTLEATEQAFSASNKIAYISSRKGSFQIHLMNTDGSDDRIVTTKEAQWVAWLPDGQHLGFTSLQGGNAIFQIAIDGSDLTSISTPGSPIMPAWSPDGKLIAFSMYSLAGNNFGLYVMKLDGTDLRMLTDKYDINPVWSPDGQTIAFSWTNDPQAGGSYAVCMITAKGTDRHCITDPRGNNVGSAWSPDGKHLAYSSVTDKNADIYIMNADGTNGQPLTTGGKNYQPMWSSDGSSIVFVSERDGNPEIYIMDADGKNQRRLTMNPEPDLFPGLKPRSTTEN